MAQTDITDDDEGKRVVDNQGNKVGEVTQVMDGTAHVEPDPGLTDAIRSRLGWSDRDQDHFTLESDRIDEVTHNEVRLK